MLRIAYDVFPMLEPPTGVGHYAAVLLEKLIDLQAGEFELYAFKWRGDTSRIPPGQRLRQIRLPGRLVVTLWEAAGIPKADQWLGEPDIVHGTNFWVPPVSPAKSIVTIHDLTFWLFPELCTSQIQRYRWIVPRMLRRVGLVITPSATIKNEIAEELKFPEDRIVATPEGIRGAFKGAAFDPALAKRLGIQKPYILFAGTQEPRKNLDRLIRAFASLDQKDLQLVIAGPPGWGSIDLPAVARHESIESRVIFPGYLRNSQLASMVAGARAFAFPSIYEGFGLPPLEAMAAGIPVVAGKAGALPEVLGDAPFWCDPQDISSIAEAIRAATSDEERRAVAIEQGRIRASRYDWDETARLTLAAYKRVAGGG